MAAQLTMRMSVMRPVVVAQQVVRPGRQFFSGAALRVQTAAAQTKTCRRQTVMKSENDVLGGSYAIALVEAAQESNTLEAVHADMDALAKILQDNVTLKDTLANPIIADEKKKSMLSTIAKDCSFTEYTLSFLNLLVDARRVDALDEIVAAFEVKYCSLTDTQVATLRSAVKLEQEQQFLIAKKLQELTGSKNIKLKPVLDESLIAGFVVEYGSSQIDLSVKGQLDKISTELQEAALAA